MRYTLYLHGRPIDRSRRYKKATEARGNLSLAHQIEYKTMHNNYTWDDVKLWVNAGLINRNDFKILGALLGETEVDTEVEEILGIRGTKQIGLRAVNEFISRMFIFDPKKRDIPKRLRLAILNRDKGVCQACGSRAPDVEIHIDHILPFSEGGKTLPENLQCLCITCNSTKNSKFI